MDLPRKFWSFSACLVMALIVIPTSVGQENETQTELPLEVVKTAVVETETESVENTTTEPLMAMVDEDGTLHGFIYRIDGDQKLPVEAKVTLSKDGKVVETAATDESGTFSIANLAPGTYDMFAAADSFVGTQTYDVQGFSSQFTGAPAIDMQIGTGFASAPAATYDNFGSLPLQSFSAAPTCSSCSQVASSCSSCGGGCGGCGVGGGGLGGGGLRRAFGSSRLLRLGLIGGVVAIATTDASPDN